MIDKIAATTREEEEFLKNFLNKLCKLTSMLPAQTLEVHCMGAERPASCVLQKEGMCDRLELLTLRDFVESMLSTN